MNPVGGLGRVKVSFLGLGILLSWYRGRCMDIKHSHTIFKETALQKQ